MFSESSMCFMYIAGVFTQKVDYMVEEAKRLAETVGLTHPAYSMTMQPDGGDIMAKTELYFKVFRELQAKLAGTAVQPGILVQSIIGHGWAGGILNKDLNKYIINETGKTVYRQCPLDEAFRKYTYDMIYKLASLRPAFLLIDDDLRQINNSESGLECFCDLHVAEFNRRTGRSFTSEELRAHMKTAPYDDELVQAFEKLRQDTILDYAKIIRSAIDAVDENIPCGCCAGGGEYYLMNRTAKVLAGKNPAFLRIHNAMYMEISSHDFAPRMFHTAFMRKCAGDVPFLLDEADTCPHNRYSKSAISMHAHIVGGILNGLNGAKLWLTNLRWPDEKDSARYEQIMAANMGLYDALMNTVKTVKWQGPVTILPDKEYHWHPAHARDVFSLHDWQSEVLDRFGIPANLGTYVEGGVHLITKDMLPFIDEATLKKILCGKALLDGQAALVLQDMGYGAYLGVTLEHKEYRLSAERILSSGKMMTFLNDFSAPFIVPGPKSTVVSEFIAFPFRGAPDFSVVGPGSVVSTNEFGGKVAITAFHIAMTPYNWMAPFRKDWLLELLDNLNGKPYPYVSLINQDTYLRHGILPDGTNLVAMFNLNFDAMQQVELRAPAVVKNVELMAGNGRWQNVPFSQADGVLTIEKNLACYEFAAFRITE